MLVRNKDAASATSPDGVEYVWKAGADVEVPDDFANAICDIKDSGFVATADVEPQAAPRRRKAAQITEVDPEATSPETVADEA